MQVIKHEDLISSFKKEISKFNLPERMEAQLQLNKEKQNMIKDHICQSNDKINMDIGAQIIASQLISAHRRGCDSHSLNMTEYHFNRPNKFFRPL